MSSITCKAAVLYEEGKPHKIEDITVPAPGKGEIRIKMTAAGICASDAHHAWGEQKLEDVPSHRVPCVLGHEGSGIVESIGSDVQDIKVGDHVLVSIMPQCKDCKYCRATSRTNNCLKLNLWCLGEMPNKFSLSGERICSFAGLGIFAEYALLKRGQVVKIDNDVPLENACLISCSVTTGFYSAMNLAQVQPESVAVVWGIGAIGLNTLFGCKTGGAEHIIAVDINDDKRDLALAYGATDFINPTKLGRPIEEYLNDKFGGIDYAFDCVGHPTVIKAGLAALNHCGRYVQIGLPHPTTMIEYPAWQLVAGRSIVSAILGAKPVDTGFTELAQMYKDGRYDIDRMVTHRLRLDQIDDGFALLKSGKSIRSVIIFDQK